MTGSVTTVLVVGATGSIGRLVVATALERGLQVRALAREVGRGRRLLPGADVVAGDLTSAATLGAAVDGVDAVVFTHGASGGRGAYERVDDGGVANLLQALEGRRSRIALMSWKRRSERLVRASGSAYTIVRPGWFDPGAPTRDWAAIFATTAPDRPGSIDGVRDLATLPMEAEPAAVRRDLDDVAAAAGHPSDASA